MNKVHKFWKTVGDILDAYAVKELAMGAVLAAGAYVWMLLIASMPV